MTSLEERNKAYGIPIPNSLDADCQPIDAIVVVKFFDKDGDVCYALQSSAGIHSVEAMGMLEFGAQMLQHQMFEHHSGPQDDSGYSDG